MILFHRRYAPSINGPQLVALFGVGLVGGAIAHALERQHDCSSTRRPLDWLSPERRAGDLEVLSQAIDSYDNPDRLDVIWAAGKAGFGSSREELGAEMRAFTDVLTWARNLRSIALRGRLHFHMLSSGGGLFEGQRFVDHASVPNPQRAYGQIKLEQERLLGEARRDLEDHVYRPSSIYGYNGPGGRAGLVNTLIANAERHAVSRIFGDLTTVRDYVLSSDVGDFIARRIISSEVAPGTFTLASGKPTTVKEMLDIVREVVARPLYVKLDSIPSNAGHITYRASVLPADWHPTDLETGVRQLARQLSMSFDAGARR